MDCHTKVPLPPRGENYRTKFSSIVLNMQGILYPCIISRDVLLRIIFLAKKLGLELAVGVRLEVLCHTHVSPSCRMYLHGGVPTTHALPGLQDRRAAQGMISGTTTLQESDIGQEKLRTFSLLHFTSVSKQRFKPHGTATYS